MKKSHIIESFLNFVKECEEICVTSKANIENEDKLTQDLLHKLELEDNTVLEEADIAKQLKDCRKRRREYKDEREIATCLEEWSSENQKCIEKLKQTLGKMRKTEEYHQNRIYNPKILH